jgi:TorA maturation chaperone TorD
MPDYDANKGTARENLCRYLAACYYQPDPAFAEERMFESMLEAAGKIHPDVLVLARRLGEAFAQEGPESLLVDYTRLFLGPTHALAQPYGSIWLDGPKIVMGESTVALLEIYEAGGFKIAEDFRELPDHIAAELEFLYLLIYRQNETHRIGEPEAVRANAALRERFLTEHLSRWVGPFAAAVSAGAQSTFYRSLSKITERFVAMEVDEINAA